MKRIYVAAPFAARDLARAVAEELITNGHVVTSTWILSERAISQQTVGTSPASPDAMAKAHAIGDLGDIAKSDVLLQLTEEFCLNGGVEVEDIRWLHTGGRQVEFGYALAKGLPIHLLGRAENIFTRTMAVPHVSVEDFLVSLKSL